MRQWFPTTDLASRAAWTLARWRRAVHFRWYAVDREAWLFAGVVGAIVIAFGVALRGVFSYQDERRESVRQFHQRHVNCLALNVYYEARGEPLAGQYAVAEVTMNRKASRRYPDTICDVVYQKNWDSIRGRYVGAFSWTEFDRVPEPGGEGWVKARKVAEAVYYRRDEPALKGALYFHATHIDPGWTKQKKPVARIGKHIFYR